MVLMISHQQNLGKLATNKLAKSINVVYVLHGRRIIILTRNEKNLFVLNNSNLRRTNIHSSRRLLLLHHNSKAHTNNYISSKVQLMHKYDYIRLIL